VKELARRTLELERVVELQVDRPDNRR